MQDALQESLALHPTEISGKRLTKITSRKFFNVIVRTVIIAVFFENFTSCGSIVGTVFAVGGVVDRFGSYYI